MAVTLPELRRMALGGIGWESLSFFFGRLSTILATIVLARLLTPEDFGLVAFALAFAACAGVITDLGMGRALIYFPPDMRQTTAAAALTATSAGAVAVVSFLLAPTLAAIARHAEVVGMIRALSCGLFVEGLGQIPDGILRKQFRFRARMVAHLLMQFTRAGVSVTLALAGFNGWAIIIGYVAAQVVWTAVSWPLSRASLSPLILQDVRGRAASLLRYGIPVAGNALLVTLLFNVDYAIVARRLGAEPLGLYMLALRIADLAILQALWIVGAVTFPMYSAIRDDTAALRNTYVTATRIQTAFGVGAGMVLALLASFLVPFLFGPQWTRAIVLVQALSLYAAFRTVGTGITELANALGKPRVTVWLSLGHLALLGITVWPAAGVSIEAVAWTQVCVAAAIALISQSVALRLLGLPLHSLVTYRTTPAVAAVTST